MLEIVNSVTAGEAISVIREAQKKPFIISLRARQGVTDVASFYLMNAETIQKATDMMYYYHEAVCKYEPGTDYSNKIGSVHYLMYAVDKVAGECVFRIDVEKLEI